MKANYVQLRIQNFPLGGRQPIGGADLQHRHILAEMYVKTKELGPVRGGAGGPPGYATDVGPYPKTQNTGENV